MTVDKILGLIGTSTETSSVLKSWRDYKVNQLPYCKTAALVLTTAIDSFSTDLMYKAEYSGFGAFYEESTAIVGLVLNNKDQFRNLWHPFLETLQNGNEYEIVNEEDAIKRIA